MKLYKSSYSRSVRNLRLLRVRARQFQSYAGITGWTPERKGCCLLNSKDIEFSNCTKVIEGKARLPYQQGFGKRPNAAKAKNCCGPKECFQAIPLSYWYRPCGSCSPRTLVWGAVWSTSTCTLKILPSAPTTTVLNSWLMRKPHEFSPRWTSHGTKSCSTQDDCYRWTEVLC